MSMLSLLTPDRVHRREPLAPSFGFFIISTIFPIHFLAAIVAVIGDKVTSLIFLPSSLATEAVALIVHIVGVLAPVNACFAFVIVQAVLPVFHLSHRVFIAVTTVF